MTDTLSVFPSSPRQLAPRDSLGPRGREMLFPPGSRQSCWMEGPQPGCRSQVEGRMLAAVRLEEKGGWGRVGSRVSRSAQGKPDPETRATQTDLLWRAGGVRWRQLAQSATQTASWEPVGCSHQAWSTPFPSRGQRWPRRHLLHAGPPHPRPLGLCSGGNPVSGRTAGCAHGGPCLRSTVTITAAGGARSLSGCRGCRRDDAGASGQAAHQGQGRPPSRGPLQALLFLLLRLQPAPV